MEWIDRIEENLRHTCNGDVSTEMGGRAIVCKYKNGKVQASIAADGTRMLTVRKYHPRYPEVTIQKVSLESHTDEMVITQSLKGSLEFLHRNGQNPEVRIEQNDQKIGSISIFGYNDEVGTAVYADIDL